MKLKHLLPFGIMTFMLFAPGVAQAGPQVRPAKEKVAKEAKVYICDSKGSKVYHSRKSCRGY